MPALKRCPRFLKLQNSRCFQMGRLPQTTEKLKLSGAMRHDPGRYANRTTEGTPTGPVGNPPKHLSAELKIIWYEIRRQISPGVLRSADRLIVELLCRLTFKMRSETITTGETSQLLSCLCHLGMSPADRSRAQVIPSLAKPRMEPSPFAAFSGTQSTHSEPTQSTQ